jgi:hypothetical protein
MLNAEAIDKIREYRYEIKEFGSRNHPFIVTPEGAKALSFPVRKTAELFSLSQVVSFVKLLIAEKADHVTINVPSHLKISVWTKLLDDNLNIETAAAADFSSVFEPFPFGRQLTQEEFIINVMTKFEDDESRAELLKLVSSVKDARLSTSDDDGISQVVATKMGVHLASETAVKNLWKLQTFKTFPEVEQPVIPYILRLHQRESEMPKFALYECDGGKWKIETTIAIREWLKNQLKSSLEDKADLVTVL